MSADPLPDPSLELARRWYVACTKPGGEDLALQNLTRQGFTSFLPRISRTVRHARKTSQVLRPLFPRYLFVSLDLDVDRWGAVRSTIGISSLVMNGERPGPVPRGVTESIMAATNGAGGSDSHDGLIIGGTVQFLTGPFADRLGVLVRMNDAQRVGGLLELLGSQREVAVRPGQLRAVK
jgi:transcription elongation factor/antiterminator RfaH